MSAFYCFQVVKSRALSFFFLYRKDRIKLIDRVKVQIINKVEVNGKMLKFLAFFDEIHVREHVVIQIQDLNRLWQSNKN